MRVANRDRLEEEAKRLYDDIEVGRAEVVSVVPTTAQLDNGEFQFYESGVTIRLYVNLNGTIRYVNLT